MSDIAKEIVIAMLQNGYITKSSSNEQSIKDVSEAYKEIYKQVRNCKNNVNKD